MNYTVILKDNETGEQKKYTDKWCSNTGFDGLIFFWEEGNAACDCCRHKLFYPDSKEDFPCNIDDNRFELLEIKLETGLVIYPDKRYEA